MKSLGIRVTDTVYATIKAAAERDKRSMAKWIALAIDEKLTRSSAGEQGRPRSRRVTPGRSNVGKDTAEPVSDDYPGSSPWPFTGGTSVRAAVDVSGTPFVDLAEEARMAFARD